MKCPGQDSRYWTEEAVFEVTCPECGSTEEFFKDEPTRRCKHCGHKIINPKMDFGCAAYCKFAPQCLGELPPELIAQRNELLKHRVAVEMKHFFGKDFKRIGHASKVARYAEEIVKQEKGDPAVVLTAAYLHDMGGKEAEGPPLAREILLKLGANPELIEEVCDIIRRHHHPRDQETVNFKVVYDADLIVNLEEKQSETFMDREKMEGMVEKGCFTESGKMLAKNVFLKQN